MCVCRCTYATVHIRKAEDNFQELKEKLRISFHHVGTGN